MPIHPLSSVSSRYIKRTLGIDHGCMRRWCIAGPGRYRVCAWPCMVENISFKTGYCQLDATTHTPNNTLHTGEEKHRCWMQEACALCAMVVRKSEQAVDHGRMSAPSMPVRSRGWFNCADSLAERLDVGKLREAISWGMYVRFREAESGEIMRVDTTDHGECEKPRKKVHEVARCCRARKNHPSSEFTT